MFIVVFGHFSSLYSFFSQNEGSAFDIKKMKEKENNLYNTRTLFLNIAMQAPDSPQAISI